MNEIPTYRSTEPATVGPAVSGRASVSLPALQPAITRGLFNDGAGGVMDAFRFGRWPPSTRGRTAFDPTRGQRCGALIDVQRGCRLGAVPAAAETRVRARENLGLSASGGAPSGQALSVGPSRESVQEI